MCEYCGCQNVAVIAELTAEHDQLRDLGRRLMGAAAADDHPAAAACARRMLAVLDPHTRVEEQGLFPAMAGDFPTQISELRTDHRRTTTALRAISDGALPGWPALATATVTELFEHILKEQDGVFPASLSILTPQQWDQVAEARLTVPTAATGPAG